MRLLLSATLALLASPFAHAQILVLESTNDDAMLFDAFDGSLINMQFLDLNISTGVAPNLPQEILFAPNGDLLVTDQNNGRVSRYSGDGTTYLGQSSTPLANVRGGEVAYGSVWIANAATTGGAPGPSLVQLDLNLNLIQAHVLAFSPWDVKAFNWMGIDGLLVTDIDGEAIQFFDPANPGAPVVFHDSDGVTGIDFPQYMATRHSNGRLIVAGFSPPVGIFEYDPITGAETAYFDVLTSVGLRGVAELGNGNFLFTNNSGVHIFDPVALTSVTVVGGVAGRGISEMPGGSLGSSYCGPAVPNSTGNPGDLTAAGSAAVVDNNVALIARSLPNGAFGYFLASQTQGNSPQPAGSQGVLCLGGSIGRYVGPGQIMNSGTAGGFTLVLDLTLTPTPGGLAPINPGETWNFQAWYRDLNPQVTSNFTDGRSITFQ